MLDPSGRGGAVIVDQTSNFGYDDTKDRQDVALRWSANPLAQQASFEIGSGSSAVGCASSSSGSAVTWYHILWACAVNPRRQTGLLRPLRWLFALVGIIAWDSNNAEDEEPRLTVGHVAFSVVARGIVLSTNVMLLIWNSHNFANVIRQCNVKERACAAYIAITSSTLVWAIVNTGLYGWLCFRAASFEFLRSHRDDVAVPLCRFCIVSSLACVASSAFYLHESLNNGATYFSITDKFGIIFFACVNVRSAERRALVIHLS